MGSLRTVCSVLVLAAFFAAGPALAFADAAPSDSGHGNKHAHAAIGGPAQDRGTLSGSVASVDYSGGSMVIDTPRGRVTVQITPSTSVFRGKSGYAALTDLATGMHVQVFVSEVDGRLVAQIIRIR